MCARRAVCARVCVLCVHVSKERAQFVDTDGSNKADQRGSITKRLSLTPASRSYTHTLLLARTRIVHQIIFTRTYTHRYETVIAINICLITWFLCGCNKCRLSTVDF